MTLSGITGKMMMIKVVLDPVVEEAALWETWILQEVDLSSRK